ncbi:MAG: hypothetical protein WB780_19830 [Candidatus Acidiferrales bacterium]
MKGILVLSAVLLLSGAAHAQGFSGASISPITIDAAPITSYSRITRQCNCTVVSGRNDGLFAPTAFEAYEQAMQDGEAALKAGQPSIVEAAQLNREQKKAATQKATLYAMQDNRGRVILTAVRP